MRKIYFFFRIYKLLSIVETMNKEQINMKFILFKLIHHTNSFIIVTVII